MSAIRSLEDFKNSVEENSYEDPGLIASLQPEVILWYLKDEGLALSNAAHTITLENVALEIHKHYDDDGEYTNVVALRYCDCRFLERAITPTLQIDIESIPESFFPTEEFIDSGFLDEIVSARSPSEGESDDGPKVSVTLEVCLHNEPGLKAMYIRPFKVVLDGNQVLSEREPYFHVQTDCIPHNKVSTQYSPAQ